MRVLGCKRKGEATPKAAVRHGASPRTKLRIGSAYDPLEREADRVADAVMQGRSPGPTAGIAPLTAQRKCAAREAEEERSVRRKESSSAKVSESVAGTAAAAVSNGGAPLSPGERAYFEPRFGRSLSAVRIHTDAEAAAAADNIDARAFTLGAGIAFASGEYRPETDAGRRLLAHELAHTFQQERGAAPVLRRATYGSGAPFQRDGRTLAEVPQDERAHVDEAIAKVDEVVADPATYAECHRQYRDRCPSGTDASLTTVWNNATLWKITTPAPNVYAWGSFTSGEIAYTPLGYSQSPMGLAGTFLHEAGHNCGIRNNRHWHAELLANYCMGAGANEISASGGPNLSGELPLLMFSYRRFLGDWAGGRMRLTLGADLNAMGVISEIAERNQPSAERTTVELGSAMAGVHARLGGWGGSRYGGFAFRVETGIGAGRFSLRPVAAGEPRETTFAPDWILQVGPRAEFLIKSGDAHVLPLSVGVAARLAVPLNGDAQTMQSVQLSIGGAF